MDKTVINLRDWSLTKECNKYYLKGIADKHPKLGTNAVIGHTSSILEATIKDDVLTVETRNSIYVCPIKYISIDRNNWRISIVDSASEFKELDDLYRSIHNAVYDKIDTGEERHIKDLSGIGQVEMQAISDAIEEHLIEEVIKYDDSLYLDITSFHVPSSIAYNIGVKHGVIKGILFDEDDIIRYVMDEKIYFSYSAIGVYMNIINIANNIKNIVIKNSKGYSIIINDSLRLEPDEVTFIENNKVLGDK